MCLETLHIKYRTSFNKTPHAGSALHTGTLIPIYLFSLTEGLAEGSRFANRFGELLYVGEACATVYGH